MLSLFAQKKTILETDAERVLHSVKFEVRASNGLEHRFSIPSLGRLQSHPGVGTQQLQENPKLAGPLSQEPCHFSVSLAGVLVLQVRSGCQSPAGGLGFLWMCPQGQAR